MKKQFLYAFVMLNLLCSRASIAQPSRPNATDIAVEWAFEGNQIEGKPQYRARFTLKNNGKVTLPAKGWTIYYNQLAGTPIPDSLSPVVFKRITGDFYSMQPTAAFKAIAPGASTTFAVLYTGALIKATEAPCGLYIVFKNADGKEQKPELLSNYTVTSSAQPEQLARSANDLVPIPSPEQQFRQFALYTALPEEQFSKIIPTPVKMVEGNEFIKLDASFRLQSAKGLSREDAYFRKMMESIFGKRARPQGEPTAVPIVLKIDSTKAKKESYSLTIEAGKGIAIIGADPAGVFYGIQSLMAWLPPDVFKTKQTLVTIKTLSIEDAPRFGYRGLHLDASRNFHKKEAVLKLLDVMAFYKLNKLHFHLADDEGWRLEIPQLPELTQVGAFRGHTLNEEAFLYPAYGSGLFTDPAVSHGSGFYTISDFIEILKYARERHIEVIPEFDTPGHSRAAIKAMQARYNRLMKEGKPEEAKAYLLNDPADSSRYESVQGYADNVICVCQESTYRFWEKIIAGVRATYQAAGAPLTTIHIGGDEVPKGVWEKSPACAEWMKNNPKLKTMEDLAIYYIERVNQLLQNSKLRTGGWEEIALKTEKAGNASRYAPNPKFIRDGLVPYVWNNLSGNQDLGNRLANAGYPIVLCNVTNLYFDLAFNKDFEEPGLSWGGFVDTRKPFEFVPEDVFKSTTTDPLGNAFNTDEFYKTMEKLTDKGKANILGIQGELWSETIKGQEMLEYYALPKLLGLAERAWAAQPEWAAMEQKNSREAALNNAWHSFANSVGKRELPRLDYLFGGFNYRIAPPGAVIEKGVLKAAAEFPGLQIRYTLDNSEPTMQSPLYEKPFNAGSTVKLKTFDTRGRGSRTITLTP